MNFARMAFSIVAAVLVWSSSELLAAPTNQILFLQLKLQRDAIAPVKSSISPGVLKPQPNPQAREIQYELLSASGEVLWRGGLDVPTARQGRTVEAVEFTLRVPVIAEAQRLEFFRLEVVAGDGTEEGRRSAEAPPRPKVVRRFLGSVPFPTDGDASP